jgi:hypothetical protein
LPDFFYQPRSGQVAYANLNFLGRSFTTGLAASSASAASALKIQQKVSGCIANDDGIQERLDIRSYI